jgi:ArsR family transcriptional regulator
LKVLREAGLITGTKRGTWIWYRVNRDRLQVLQDVLG